MFCSRPTSEAWLSSSSRPGSPAVGARFVTPPATSHDARLAGEAGRAAGALLRQAASQDWRGPDPYDGLYFPMARLADAAGAGGARRSCRPTLVRRSTFAVSTGARTRGSPRRWECSARWGCDWDRPGTRTPPGSAWSRSGCSMPIAPRATSRGGTRSTCRRAGASTRPGSPNVVVTSFAVHGLLEGATAADQPHLHVAGRRGGALGARGSVGGARRASSPITRQRR